MRRIAALVVAVASLAATRRAVAEGERAPPARTLAEPRVRSSLTWLFGDDDALHAPSDVRPSSPAPAVGDRGGYDTLGTGFDSRFTGRENELVLGVVGEAPGFLPGVSTRAEVALGLELAGLAARPAAALLSDRGSALELSLALGHGTRPPRLSVRLLPLNADRLRVGWLELLAWGGEAGPHRDSPYAEARTPPRGAALAVSTGLLSAEVGLKTATFLEPVPGGPAVEEASYGGYGLLELRAGGVAVGVGVGRFEHGRLEGLQTPPRAVTMGVSLRASFGRGLTTPRVPFALGLEAELPLVEGEDPTSGWVVGVEGATLVERLRSFDEPGRSVLSPARAVAVVGTLRLGVLEARAALALREPAFVMRSVPGVFEGLTLPGRAASQSDLLGLGSVSVRVLPFLEPGLSFGLRSPAAVMTATLDSLGQPTGATVVAYAPGAVELLPPGEAPVPIVEVCPSLGLRLSPLLAVTAWLGYRRDYNRTRLASVAPSGAVARRFAEPDRLFYGLAARAVW